MSIFFTIIILGLIIFLHELGHFLTAKYYKMPVLEFAIGMGPRIFTKKINETNYSIRILPLGGFVNIDGMQPADDPEKNVKNGFYTKSPLSRFVVLIAGIMMNFISAIIGIFILLSITGVVPPKYIKPVIKTVQEKSAAKNILQAEDKIIGLNGKKINNWQDLTLTVMEINQKGYKNEEIPIKILRNNKEMNEKIRLTYNEERKMSLLGIEAAQTKVSVLKKIEISFYTFGNYLGIMIDGLKMLVTGKVSMNEVTGPVGLPKFVGQAYELGGGTALINIFILLSINIGLMNLLPIPALDGGGCRLPDGKPRTDVRGACASAGGYHRHAWRRGNRGCAGCGRYGDARAESLLTSPRDAPSPSPLSSADPPLGRTGVQRYGIGGGDRTACSALARCARRDDLCGDAQPHDGAERALFGRDSAARKFYSPHSRDLGVPYAALRAQL